MEKDKQKTPLQLDVAEGLLRGLLASMGVSFQTIEHVSHIAHPVIVIKTEESGALIGNRGETLQALNYLLRKQYEKKVGEDGSGQFLVDVNNYQLRKIEELRQKALMLAERARLFKHDVEMNPMSAYERMIVHATFAETEDIGTESHGEGKFRRVVIKWRADQKPSA